MNKLARIALLLVIAMGAFFSSCSTEDPHIVCGREWNPALQLVADTTSEFELINPMILQFRYGTGFDFPTLKIAFYEGTEKNKGKEIWHYETKVNEKVSVYTLQGHSKRGGLMTAAELTRHRAPGQIVIEATTGDRLLAVKEITLVKNKI